MKRIISNLFIGNEEDYIQLVPEIIGWSVVHACRNPYHREAVGYTSFDAPRISADYYVAQRGNRLCLNISDVPDPREIHHEVIDPALDYIEQELKKKQKVLVHGKDGISRSPGIGLLYLAKHTNLFEGINAEDAMLMFRKIYPDFNPSPGIAGYIKQNFEEYSIG